MPGRTNPLTARLRRTFSHRRLLLVESLLVVGLLETLGESWVRSRDEIPNWGKVIFLMALVVGLFGALVVVLEKTTTKTLQKTHTAVQALPLPTPLVVVHLAFFIGLFFAWAWVEDIAVL